MGGRHRKQAAALSAQPGQQGRQSFFQGRQQQSSTFGAAHKERNAGVCHPPSATRRAPACSPTHHEPAKEGGCRLKGRHPAAKALQGLHRKEDGTCSRAGQGRAGRAGQAGSLRRCAASCRH